MHRTTIYSIIFAALVTPLRLLATVGEPESFVQGYFDPARKEIWYIHSAGHWNEIRRVTLPAGEMAVVASEEENDEDFARLKEQLENFIPLREVDLERTGLDFKSNLLTAKNAWKEDGTVDEEAIGDFPYTDVKMLWQVSTSLNEQLIARAEIPSCPYTNSIAFRGYSAPEQDFVFVMATTVALCFEFGYTVDTGILLNNIEVTDKEYLTRADTAEDNETVEGRIYSKLSEKALSHLLNDIGFQAYKERKYETAIKYFDAAHAWHSEDNNYLLPLYNRACTEAKTEQVDAALASIEELLSFAESRKKYLRKIHHDSDFDSIRNDSRFKALIDDPQQP